MTTLFPQKPAEGSEGRRASSDPGRLKSAPQCPDRIHELVQQAQERDQAALEELLGLFRPLIRTVFQHYAGWPSLDQDDLLAEVMLAFLHLVQQFDPARGLEFPGYIRQMLIADVHSYVRRQLAHQESSVPPTIPDVPSSLTTNHLLWEEEVVDRLCLREAICRLTRRQQQVINLSFFQGYTQKEIAGQLGITQQKVSTLRRRALRRLRKILEGI